MAKALGHHSTFRYTRRTLSPQVGDDYFDDRRPTRWRRIQFRYVPLLSLVNRANNLVVDLANYPNSFFLFLMAVGVYLIRRQRRQVSALRSEFRAWDAAIILFIASKAFLLVMPWYPPAGGIYAGSVSFFYATSSITGISM